MHYKSQAFPDVLLHTEYWNKDEDDCKKCFVAVLFEWLR